MKTILLCIIKIILHFLKTADITNFTGSHNILFIEGPINDYKEEAVQVKNASKNYILFYHMKKIDNPLVVS